MHRPRRLKAPVTREKLIEAAGEIFAEKGLHGTSIRDITQRAGANVASVNYHFHDKFELYAQVLRRAHQGIVAAMSRPLTAKTPEGRFRELITAMLKSALDPSRPKWQTRVLGRELFQPTPVLDLMYDLVRPTAHRLSQTMGEMRPDLSFQQLTLAAAGVVARAVFHVYHGHLVQRMFPAAPEATPDELIEHVVEFSLAALRGLQAPPACGQNHRPRSCRATAKRRANAAHARRVR